jgi:hypothetical protein
MQLAEKEKYAVKSYGIVRYEMLVSKDRRLEIDEFSTDYLLAKRSLRAPAWLVSAAYAKGLGATVRRG